MRRIFSALAAVIVLTSSSPGLFTRTHKGSSWLVNYEVPACRTSLGKGEAYSYKLHESVGPAFAYVCTTPDSYQRVVTHTYKDGGTVRRNLTLLYDGRKHCALWVAIAMNADAFKDNAVGRSNAWGYDPALPKEWQPDLGKSYTGATRGHQIASSYRLASYQQNAQTFYYSNMTPQTAELNNGKWNSLEQSVRRLASGVRGRDTLYVVTGPVFDKGYESVKDRGGKSCPMPTRYYKCLMKCSFGPDGVMTGALGKAVIYDQYTSERTDTVIDEVERITGFDFFANVPQPLQNEAESHSGLRL